MPEPAHAPPIARPDTAAAFAAEVIARTGLTEEVLARLVHRFYARVRQDAVLAPVFAARITDWPPHLARMCAFWSSVVLMSGRYHGAPVSAHQGLPVDADHVARWLALFGETARDTCTAEGAVLVEEKAQRIARSLQFAVAAAAGGAPALRPQG